MGVLEILEYFANLVGGGGYFSRKVEWWRRGKLQGYCGVGVGGWLEATIVASPEKSLT